MTIKTLKKHKKANISVNIHKGGAAADASITRQLSGDVSDRTVSKHIRIPSVSKDIFDDAIITEMRKKLPFSGIGTIDLYNSDDYKQKLKDDITNLNIAITNRDLIQIEEIIKNYNVNNTNFVTLRTRIPHGKTKQDVQEDKEKNFLQAMQIFDSNNFADRISTNVTLTIHPDAKIILIDAQNVLGGSAKYFPIIKRKLIPMIKNIYSTQKFLFIISIKENIDTHTNYYEQLSDDTILINSKCQHGKSCETDDFLLILIINLLRRVYGKYFETFIISNDKFDWNLFVKKPHRLYFHKDYKLDQQHYLTTDQTMGHSQFKHKNITYKHVMSRLGSSVSVPSRPAAAVVGPKPSQTKGIRKTKKSRSTAPTIQTKSGISIPRIIFKD